MKKRENNEFVYIDDEGFIGRNFYWDKGLEIGISKNELVKVGLQDERVRVHKDIISSLKKVKKELQNKGYGLYITEGYRSKKLYKLINEKISRRIGTEDTGKILNMKDMPHSSGKSIDVALWKNNKKIVLHNKEDGINGYFVNFYKDFSNSYHKLQEMLISIMQNNGFRLGKKREYFHFNYEPNSPKNYPKK